jgi:hypothetical protein
MKDEPIARRALRLAERGVGDDAARLVASVPGMIREARRRRSSAGGDTFSALATWALPRLAGVTAVAVLAATALIFGERSSGSATEIFESVVLGTGESAADAVLEAVLDAERNDG